MPTFDPEHAVKQTAVSTKDSLQIINDTEFTYSEGWTPYRLTPRWLGYFNNTNTSSSSAGAWAEYLFSNCESIVLYCAVGKEHGKGLVYLDGGAPVEIDTYREEMCIRDSPYSLLRILQSVCLQNHPVLCELLRLRLMTEAVHYNNRKRRIDYLP